MKGYISILTARFGRLVVFRWLLRWPESSGVSPLRMIIGVVSLVGLIASPFFGRMVHLVPPFLAQVRAIVAPAETPSQNTCAPFGGHRSLELPDHTTVELNSGTCLIERFSGKTRLVQLQSGEALFQVTRNADRPFIVETGPISIQVLGTQFDVYRKELSTRVAVIEGAVQISSHDATTRPNIKPLTPLQELDVPDDTAQPRIRKPITPGDFDRITAWKHGSIDLDRQTLQEALDEFERYQHIQIQYDDPRIAALRFTGQFHTNELDRLLHLLKLQCIDSIYDKDAQRITLTPEPGKRPGGYCQ